MPTPDNSPGCATGQYVAGAQVNLAASPAGGWQVTGWSGTANNASTATTNSLTMPGASHTVGVTYGLVRPTCYTLTLAHTGEGGNPTAAPTRSTACPTAGQYVAGAQIALTATPAAGWQVTGWSGTANNASTATTNSLVMPGANHAASVAYGQAPPTCYTLMLGHTRQGGNPTAAPTRSTSSAGQYTCPAFSRSIPKIADTGASL